MLSLQLLSSLRAVSLLTYAEICLAASIAFCIGWVIYTRNFHPYADIPGPYWASISNWWYFKAVRDALDERYQFALHEKYGPVVRVSPNDVQIADAAAIDQIYSAKAGFTKTEFYDSFMPNISKHRDLFTDRDEAHHATRRKIIGPFYSQGAVLEHEPQIANVIELFCKQMDKFASTGEIFDISLWLRKYTFDVIGVLFYGKENGFGFICDNIDYNGWMHTLDTMVPPVSSLSYIPTGFQGLYMGTQMIRAKTREAFRGFVQVQKDAEKAVKQRIAERAEGKKVPTHDILSKLLNLVDERGEELDFHVEDVMTELWSRIWDGSDTTAISLAAIFFTLMKHPAALEKLLNELESAFASGQLSEPVRYNDAIKLPYLRACVTEAMRLHPALGTMLPRYVPSSGAVIAGRWFAGGYRVGINATVVHCDKAVFGEDAHQFVPERWTKADPKQAASMERHLLNFGQGPRVCVGKQISMTEMYKLLPTILRRYHFELTVPEWTLRAGWFSVPRNVLVRVEQRRPGSRRAV